MSKISEYWVGREVQIEGIVMRNPVEIEDKKYLAVKPICEDSQNNQNKLKDLILISVNFYQDIQNGDKILFSGKLEENNYNPFDVFLNNKLVYTIYNGKVKILEPANHKNLFYI